MNIDDIAKIAGVLGFVISLITFVLTRWERRTFIHFGLANGSHKASGGEDWDLVDMIEFTLINLGATPVVLNLRTLEVRRGDKTLFPWL
jgi:hypothetical protein